MQWMALGGIYLAKGLYFIACQYHAIRSGIAAMAFRKALSKHSLVEIALVLSGILQSYMYAYQ